MKQECKNRFSCRTIFCRMSFLLNCMALSFLVSANAQALTIPSNVLNECTNVKAGGKVLKVTGEDLLRTMAYTLNNLTHGDRPRVEVRSAPTNAKRCSNPRAGTPVARVSTIQLGGAAGDDNSTRYYGKLTSMAAFVRMSRVGCRTGAQIVNQFFSLENAIYLRNCAPGDGRGYIYYWGMAEGKNSKCVGGHDYPTMFTEAKRGGGLTIDDLIALSERGNINNNVALGNSMAAILIAEAHRDNFLYFINPMLLQLMKKNNKNSDWGLDTFLGGLCPGKVSACGNPKGNKNGIHPLAWGGAQAVMMAGGWGGAEGATSDYGKKFEAHIINQWLIHFKGGTQNKKCKGGATDLATVRPALATIFRSLIR